MEDFRPRSATGISAPVWLTALLMAMLIPFIAFAAYSVGELNQNQRRSDELRMIERVDALSANIDREIRGMISLANALAATSYLAEGRFADFHAYAKEASAGGSARVLVLDTSMQQLVNTRVPFGTPLPKTNDPISPQRALDSGRPVVSGMFLGAVSKRTVFDVIVPIAMDGRNRYVVIVTDEPSRIARVLAEQALRLGWQSAVLDGDGKVVATDDAIAGSTGQFPVDVLQGAGNVQTMLGGQEVVLRYVKSELTGWTSVVWAPIATMNAPADVLWRTVTAASLIALLASSALAYLFARPFARLMRDTMRNVSLMGTVSDMPPIRSLLTEGSVISKSLQKVNLQLLNRQRENEEGRALLTALLDNVPEGITITGGPELRIIANSRQAIEWIEADPDHPNLKSGGIAQELVVKNIDGSTPDAEHMPLHRASRYGESTKGAQLMLERSDGRKMPIEMSVNPFRDESGKIIGAVSCWRDITERKQAEHHLRLISRELTHRAKNLLTVILGIAKQTTQPGMSIEEFLSAFSQRIQGLGASHDLLTSSDWGGAYLEELITSQLVPFGGVDGVRIKAKGPPVLLKNDVLQTLGLALHELGTNAVKYGALSVVDGTVDVSWRIHSLDVQPRLKLTWKECGGPPVKKPARKGFGHNITVRSLARVISGEVKIEFPKAGIVWTLEAPLSALALDSAERTQGEAGTAS